MAKKLITTPKGVAVWPHLHAPDTKFDAAGVYSTKVQFAQADGEKLAAEIDAAIAASVEEAKKDPKNKGKKIKAADAPYSVDEDTGEYTINFKLKASGTRKDNTTFTQQPAIFDGQNKKLPAGVRVGGGSIIRVSFEMFPFFTALVGAGVSLRLKAVQIVKLEQFGSNAQAFGFDAEDDGFDGTDIEVETTAPARGAAVDADNDGEPAEEVQSGADF